jgi:hypothetical protein
MKIILTSLTISLSAILAYGQNSSLAGSPALSPAERTTVVVPFNPNLYNNQDSPMMCEASKLNYGQLGNYIRSSFDSILVASMRDSVNVVNLIANTTTGTGSEVETIYSISKYQYAERPIAGTDNTKYAMMRDRMPARQREQQQQRPNGIHRGEIVSVKEDQSNKFMNVQFDDTDYIQSIIRKYGARYFLFITQFEILGDYSNPYRVADKTYLRTIKAHYSIFSADGRFIAGDFETAQFPAYENDIREISAKYFPAMAKNITQRLPRN